MQGQQKVIHQQSIVQQQYQTITKQVIIHGNNGQQLQQVQQLQPGQQIQGQQQPQLSGNQQIVIINQNNQQQIITSGAGTFLELKFLIF